MYEMYDPTPFINPPLYTVIILTNVVSILSGIVFKDKLEYQAAWWQLNRETETKIKYQTPGILLTFLVMCLSLVAFSTATLMVVGLSLKVAGIIAAVLVLGTAALIWWQLGSLLTMLVAGGSAAIDIDSFGAGELFDVQNK
ncbi:MAG: hypothetical protein HC818_02300 [Synechococcaceae cyanobacterium RM1_1_27]|nr:hypothetical protein [Synechococcaceae cyanobacterium SM2_3_2]NJO85636.1 hypothetical protein [Synechococcaceae cyanobacterium RM1_1_27]